MSKVTVQCTLDETVWARIDALRLTPRSGTRRRGGSQQARRELDLAALVQRGLAALEAEEAVKDTDRAPATGATATPRNDVPAWPGKTSDAPKKSSPG